MPVADGLTSTKMIRSFEKSHPSRMLSKRASLNGRVPVFAVSATLAEKDHDVYVEAGFDAWILKPINFKRLQELLTGIIDQDIRNECLYQPGKWEEGGWFREGQPDVFSAKTSPALQKQPFANAETRAEARAQERMREESLQDEAEKQSNEEAEQASDPSPLV